MADEKGKKSNKPTNSNSSGGRDSNSSSGRDWIGENNDKEYHCNCRDCESRRDWETDNRMGC